MSINITGGEVDNNSSSHPNPLRTDVSSDSPTITQLFITWLRIGFTSFGGGAVTQYLIQENFIHKNKWISAKEYTRLLGMSQITPGINILAMTILIGKRLGGRMGIVVALLGLIVPSAGITIGITATYAGFSEFPQVKSALRAVFAAIFGISLVTNWRNVKPIFVNNRKKGPLTLFVAVGIMIGSGVVYLFFNPPVVVLYLIGGLCGAITYWRVARKTKEE